MILPLVNIIRHLPPIEAECKNYRGKINLRILKILIKVNKWYGGWLGFVGICSDACTLFTTVLQLQKMDQATTAVLKENGAHNENIILPPPVMLLASTLKADPNFTVNY